MRLHTKTCSNWNDKILAIIWTCQICMPEAVGGKMWPWFEPDCDKSLMQLPAFGTVEVKRSFVSLFRMIYTSSDWRHLWDDSPNEWQLKFEGYSPDTSQVLIDVNEEENRQSLRYHSQKLAIACALIRASQGSPIRIYRNLRMRSDFHTYTKLISMIFVILVIMQLLVKF